MIRMKIHYTIRNNYKYLFYDPSARKGWEELVCCILNNETVFSRHKTTFTFTSEHIIPELIKKNGTPLRYYTFCVYVILAKSYFLQRLQE